MRRDVRNLSRYIAELEKLVEAYRSFASNAKLPAPDDMVTRRKLLGRTQEVIGQSPDEQPESHDAADAGTSAMAEAFRQAARQRT